HTDKIIFLLLLPLRWSVVVIGETELEPCGCSPHEFRLLGQVDRYRTCTLRCWNTRRGVQTRPAASKHVQPVCSQFCSQLCVRPSARRRSSHELDCSDLACTPQSDLPPLIRLDTFQGAGHLILCLRSCASWRYPRPLRHTTPPTL